MKHTFDIFGKFRMCHTLTSVSPPITELSSILFPSEFFQDGRLIVHKVCNITSHNFRLR